MSLIGLLTLGRSFGSVRVRPAPYRLADGLLPDFGQSRIHDEQRESPGQIPVRWTASHTERNEEPEAPTPTLFDLSSEAKPFCAPAETPPVHVVSATPRLSTDSARLRRRPRKAAGEAVQGELSLRSVRVLRNDLSDDDLELIPRKLPADGKVVRPGRVAANNARVGLRGWLTHWRRAFGFAPR